MDTERFLRELDDGFDDFPRSEAPHDLRFAEVLDVVPGLACPNNLALLNAAARCLASGEAYLEVGTYRGTSLIAAMLDNDAAFISIDNWSLGDGSREQLERNLARFGFADRAEILDGDAFETLRMGRLADRTVGVYYYDAGHEYEQQLEGLRLVEPYLASPSLVIVDDTDWQPVERAVADYLAEQPRAAEIVRVGGKERSAPAWWEGMTVLRFA